MKAKMKICKVYETYELELKVPALGVTIQPDEFFLSLESLRRRAKEIARVFGLQLEGSEYVEEEIKVGLTDGEEEVEG